jgi:anti-sigma factor RsiW
MSVSNDDLSCQELVELVTDYLEGRLSEPERACFEAHLALCEGCRIYLGQMQEMVRALGHLAEESIEPEAKQRLLAAFRDWRRSAS